MTGDSNIIRAQDGQRALIENFPNGVLVLFDDDLKYQIVGPRTLPFSKKESIEMVGHRIDELFPSSIIDQLESELQATIEGEQRSFDIEYTDRVHHIETQPVDIKGQSYGVLVTQGVTEERKRAKELERQNERLDQFASMISHDLRNPLSLAVADIEMFRETGDEGYLDGALEALDRIDELTTDLLTLARTDATSDEYDTVAIRTVANRAWEMVDSRQATLEIEDQSLYCDRGQLQALFENLFRNAVGHGGNSVAVRIGPLEEESGFFVEDTGSGISPEDREEVFKHGYTTGYSGSGVGLTIVSRIAQSHNWEVSLTDSEEGGARFEFRELNTVD
ncbi:sensor histidine kinase [Natronosalvus amylolyticus]|uniref:sensor histidine kinase n=1 Tax=Natronosalvus amylolyticus TaxID=2961994 RepID=UPI0020C994C0|nr:PAS domain-containing sensor histidine kinase [Natronosalvus amylolyticus]